ncbi:nucleotidyltransferase domain-containing protein [Methanobrevibacter sp.]|uniref:nucleotidyltransferase domain-containing protein n=1 Tax=Methanobrevibacter sp. TaxID=66852 RepID=UPI002E78FA76|nr:nucleotidyltransferase domain-containing protein [Methanobrevibacter sp.]MEE1336781.1 nucleotidyltransferase domain-containing protein [Methanobrevibacter sp.]
MNNRMEIAREFANAIKSDKIIRIILFGSVARGDDTEESDIDILIISNDWEQIDSLITDEVFKVVLDTEELISPYVLSEEQFNETKDFNFLTNVLEEGVVIG